MSEPRFRPIVAPLSLVKTPGTEPPPLLDDLIR